MPAVQATVDDEGLVAIEWPIADIHPDFLRPEAHAALITAALHEARRLGLPVGRNSSTIMRRLSDPGRLRFVWGIDR